MTDCEDFLTLVGAWSKTAAAYGGQTLTRPFSLRSAEHHISQVYDESLAAVQEANIVSQQSLSLLNAGQNAIISGGVALAMWLAGRGVVDGSMSVGDFVLVNVYILQLYTPLNFLGTYYRRVNAFSCSLPSLYL